MSRLGRRREKSAPVPPRLSQDLRAQARHHLFPALAAALVLSVTLLSLVRVLDLQRREDRDRFRIETRTALETLQTRVRYQERLLDAVAALYDVAPRHELSPATWYRFIHKLEPLAYSPGLVAVMHIHGPALGKVPHCVVDRYWPKDVAAKVVGVDACANKRVRRLLLRPGRRRAIRSTAPFRVWGLHDHPTVGIVLVRSLAKVGGPARFPGWVSLVLSLPRLVGQISRDHFLHVGLAPVSWTTGYFEDGASGRGGNSKGLFFVRLRLERDLLIGRRPWRVDFVRVYHAGVLPAILLAAGLAVAVLVYLLVFLSVRTQVRVAFLAEKLTARLNRNLELLRSITNNVTEGIYRSSPQGAILFCNRALAQIFGYSNLRDLLELDPARLYVHPERRKELLALLERNTSYERVEVEMQRRNGERFVALESARATFGPDGRIDHIDGVISDVTTLRQAESRAVYLDQYDKHTGLPNRTLALDRVHQAVESSRRDGSLVVVTDFDLDRFITVNDLHGQNVGDALLRDLGKNLQAIDMHEISVARIGEDEFLSVAVLPEQNYTGILLLVERLHEAVTNAYGRHAPDVGGTASVGVSLFPADACSEEELLLHAGAALREAKSRSPGSVVFYSAETHAAALNEAKLVHRLRDLAASDRFTCAFQPVVDLEARRVVGLEALARWPHDALPLVSPDVFVPLAERYRLIGRIEEAVWGRAFLVWQQWREQPWRPTDLHVNVSLRHLTEDDFEARFLALLADTAMPPHELVVELTETNFLEHPERVREIFGRLTAHGVRIAIDDFGTGYSGLSLLRRFPVAVLKVDRSCVDNVADDPGAQVIARAVAGLAADLSLELVAEGVERAVDRDVLVGFGYKRFQGFLYAPPLAAEDVPRFAASFGEHPFPGTERPTADGIDEKNAQG